MTRDPRLISVLLRPAIQIEEMQKQGTVFLSVVEDYRDRMDAAEPGSGDWYFLAGAIQGLHRAIVNLHSPATSGGT